MKKISAGLILILIFSMNVIGFAQESLDGWMYFKKINHNTSDEYKSFFLDEEVYRYAKRDLSDIRIINDKDEFIPYYIFNKYLMSEREVNVEYDLKEILSYMKKNDQYVDFQIVSKEDNVDVLGNKLEFEIEKDYFLKDIKIYGSYDNEKWDFIKRDNIYRTNEAEKLNVSLDDVYKFTYYRIVLINDVEKTFIKNSKLLFNKREVAYKDYERTKKANYSIENKGKDTIILLNNEDHLMIKDIKIISDDNFKRNYSLYYKNHNEEAYNLFNTGEIYQIKLENFKAEENKIRLNEFSNSFLSSDEIKILIDNKDNKPINIKEIEVSYYIDKVVFKDDGSNDYKVMFHNKGGKRPDYDIETYKSYIEKEKQEICSLSYLEKRDVKNIQKEDKDINYKPILNTIIILISIFLLVVIIKKSGFKDI
ncbi:hypothetical protein [Anaeromicrobium sediminis]|uniref:DUF3999 domain-containing protein n=1 Tax=Anaeromicrobium sediminis TaxID=1478221 RepID=A0A267MKS2_9FIRM|nr:hypothetical protein [Anaeromicrobium sediminis]PAB59485.1 hypothetical protein CCE28_09725 [Anaeromicrobium sediminis]